MENHLYCQDEKKPNGGMCLCRLVGLFVFVFSLIQAYEEYETQPSLYGLNKSASILLLHDFVGHGINGFSVCSNPLTFYNEHFLTNNPKKTKEHDISCQFQFGHWTPKKLFWGENSLIFLSSPLRVRDQEQHACKVHLISHFENCSAGVTVKCEFILWELQRAFPI